MNWGKGIISGMAIFMLFILAMCFYMFRMPEDEYDQKYYEKGLTFDQDYNREQQVFKDKAQPVIAIDTCCIKVTFPQAAKGQVKITRPLGNIKDQVIKFDAAGNQPFEILTNHMAKGVWQLTFEWTNNQKAYLYQKEVHI